MPLASFLHLLCLRSLPPVSYDALTPRAIPEDAALKAALAPAPAPVQRPAPPPAPVTTPGKSLPVGGRRPVAGSAPTPTPAAPLAAPKAPAPVLSKEVKEKLKARQQAGGCWAAVWAWGCVYPPPLYPPVTPPPAQSRPPIPSLSLQSTPHGDDLGRFCNLALQDTSQGGARRVAMPAV